MARRKIPNRHECEVPWPDWQPTLNPISPEEATKIKGVIDYRKYEGEYEGDDPGLDLLHWYARIHPTKVHLSPTDMVFYGSSDKHDSSIYKGIPDVQQYDLQSSTYNGHIRGTIITPPQGDELGRHMMKVDGNGQGGSGQGGSGQGGSGQGGSGQCDSLVACVVRDIASHRAIEAVCAMDEWFGVAHWQEGSPFERREIKLANDIWPHRTAWAWVLKEDSEALR